MRAHRVPGTVLNPCTYPSVNAHNSPGPERVTPISHMGNVGAWVTHLRSHSQQVAQPWHWVTKGLANRIQTGKVGGGWDGEQVEVQAAEEAQVLEVQCLWDWAKVSQRKCCWLIPGTDSGHQVRSLGMPHLTEGESEARRGKRSHPRSHSKLEPRPAPAPNLAIMMLRLVPLF